MSILTKLGLLLESSGTNNLIVSDCYHTHTSDSSDIILGTFNDTDFSEYTTGVALSDWTERWNTGYVSNVVQAGGTYTYQIGKELWINTSATPRNILTWDILDNKQDVDVLVLITSSDVMNYGLRIYARSSGSAGSEQGYMCDFESGETTTISKYVSGTYTIIATNSLIPFDDNYYWFRFRVVGTSLKLKVWQHNHPQPYDWSIETTDSSITGPGWVGIGGNAVADKYCYYFACGTGDQIDNVDIPTAFTGIVELGITNPATTSYISANGVYALGGQLYPEDRSYNIVGAGILVKGIHSDQVRFAVYSGGDLATGPDGAELIVDIGETSGTDTDTWVYVYCDAVLLPSDAPFWLAIKGNDASFYMGSITIDGHHGNFQKAIGRYKSSVVDDDETVAYPTTWPSDSGSFNTNFVDVAILIEIAGTDLIISDGTHVHTADAIVLLKPGDIQVDYSYHIHTADNISLISERDLIVAESAHVHTSDNITLGFAAVDLIVAESAHVHAADNITLDLGSLFYETDFSEYTTGVALTDWTERWVTANVSNTVQAGGTYTYQIGKELVITNTAAQRSLLTWDSLDGFEDVDLITVVKASVFADGLRIYTRASGSSGSENAYFVYFDASNIYIQKLVSGASTNIASREFYGYDSEYYWIRFQVIGTSLKVKIWSHNNVEPNYWSLTGTDSSITTGGWTGYSPYAISSFYSYYFACSNGASVGIPSSFLGDEWAGTTDPVPIGYTFLYGAYAQAGEVLPGKYYNVVGAKIYCHNQHGSQIRVAVYTGGSIVDGPEGATLLVDLGLTSGTSTGQFIELTCDPVAIPNGEWVWLAYKSDQGDFTTMIFDHPAQTGFFEQNRGYYGSSTLDDDATVAFPSTWPTDAGSFGLYWTLGNIQVEEVNASLTIEDSYHTSASDNIALDQIRYLTGLDSYHVAYSDVIVLSQNNTLSVDESSHVVYSDEPNVNSNPHIEINGAYSLLVSDTVTLSQTNNLIVAGCYHINAPPNLTITQSHNLIVAESAHLSSSDNISVDQIHNISVNDSDHVLTSDVVEVLSISGVWHGLQSDNITLLQQNNLSISECAHAVFVENLNISKSDALKGLDTYHSSASDNLYLIQNLVVAESSHEHTADSVTNSYNLVTNSADHVLISDIITLILTPNANSCYHDNISDNISLTQIHYLVVDDADHVLTNPPWIWIDDVSSTIDSDNITFTQTNTLSISESTHLQVADSMALSLIFILRQLDSYHSHTADNIWIPALPADIGNSFFNSKTVIRTFFPK